MEIKFYQKEMKCFTWSTEIEAMTIYTCTQDGKAFKERK